MGLWVEVRRISRDEELGRKEETQRPYEGNGAFTGRSTEPVDRCSKRQLLFHVFFVPFFLPA